MEATDRIPLDGPKRKLFGDPRREASNAIDTAYIGASSSSGCNVKAIIRTMYEEQREHLYWNMTEAYVKYRNVVAEWMIDVCEYFNLHQTTTHAAIAYLDRLQPNEQFSRFEWQMLAICCILISSKYNECEEHVPDLASLEEITQQQIRNETVLNFELWALKKMGWKLNARTPMAFMASFVYDGILFRGDSSTLIPDDGELIGVMTKEVFSLATAAILNTRFKKHLASALACAIVYRTRTTLGITPVWRPELTALTLCDPMSAEVQEALDVFTEVYGEPFTGPRLADSVDENVEDVNRSAPHAAVERSAENIIDGLLQRDTDKEDPDESAEYEDDDVENDENQTPSPSKTSGAPSSSSSPVATGHGDEIYSSHHQRTPESVAALGSPEIGGGAYVKGGTYSTAAYIAQVKASVASMVGKSATASLDEPEASEASQVSGRKSVDPYVVRVDDLTSS